MPTKPMEEPSVEEIAEYAEGMGYEYVDPTEFWSYYASKDWKVGRHRMVSWRKALAGWNARGRNRGEKPRRVRIEGDPTFEGRF